MEMFAAASFPATLALLVSSLWCPPCSPVWSSAAACPKCGISGHGRGIGTGGVRGP